MPLIKCRRGHMTNLGNSPITSRSRTCLSRARPSLIPPPRPQATLHTAASVLQLRYAAPLQAPAPIWPSLRPRTLPTWSSSLPSLRPLLSCHLLRGAFSDHPRLKHPSKLPPLLLYFLPTTHHSQKLCISYLSIVRLPDHKVRSTKTGIFVYFVHGCIPSAWDLGDSQKMLPEKMNA